MPATSNIHVHHLHVFIALPRGVRSVYADLTRYVCKHGRDGLVSECREVLGRNELQNNFTNVSPVETLLSNTSTGITRKRQLLIFGRWQASTIFLGSMASLSTCSSMIFPSFPIRKFTRLGAWYSSL